MQTRGMDPSWRRIHLVGLGGARMTALARVFVALGLQVSGSDAVESAALASMRQIGVTAWEGHDPEHVKGADVVIWSPAIAQDNPELMAAVAVGAALMPGGEALARVVSGKRVIAVGGTHGKTTTSAMVAAVLEAAGTDPTWLLGADLRDGRPGGRLGGGDVAVVEADEAYGSFLYLTPEISIVTSVDEDHLDYYGTMGELANAFKKFVDSSAKTVVCIENEGAAELGGEPSVVTYGVNEGDFHASDVRSEAWKSSFLLHLPGGAESTVELQAGGLHNVQNAIAAAAACFTFGLAIDDVAKGLGSFKGTARRFEFKGKAGPADVIDDYAHLPAKVEATLRACRTGPWKRIIAVFQPHLYSRTNAMWERLGKALTIADIVVVTDVCGAREAPIPGVTGKLVADGVSESTSSSRVVYLPSLDQAREYVIRQLREGDLVITLGAGDITTLADALVRENI